MDARATQYREGGAPSTTNLEAMDKFAVHTEAMTQELHAGELSGVKRGDEKGEKASRELLYRQNFYGLMSDNEYGQAAGS